LPAANGIANVKIHSISVVVQKFASCPVRPSSELVNLYYSRFVDLLASSQIHGPLQIALHDEANFGFGTLASMIDSQKGSVRHFLRGEWRNPIRGVM
jgi:hypothetical protein